MFVVLSLKHSWVLIDLSMKVISWVVKSLQMVCSMSTRQDLNCWSNDEYIAIVDKESDNENLGHQAHHTGLNLKGS